MTHIKCDDCKSDNWTDDCDKCTAVHDSSGCIMNDVDACKIVSGLKARIAELEAVTTPIPNYHTASKIARDKWNDAAEASGGQKWDYIGNEEKLPLIRAEIAAMRASK